MCPDLSSYEDLLLFYRAFVFFFNDTAPTEIYTLSLHDALPISLAMTMCSMGRCASSASFTAWMPVSLSMGDRKSTRLNSSHPSISYAVFCLKKKKHKTSLHHHVPPC